MNRKIIYIVVGAIVIIALIGLAWWWFLNRTNTPNTLPSSSSGFGTAQNTTGNATVNSGTQTNVPNTTNAGTTGGVGSNPTGNEATYSPTSGLVGYSPSAGAPIGVAGVVWLSGSPTTGGGTGGGGPGTGTGPGGGGPGTGTGGGPGTGTGGGPGGGSIDTGSPPISTLTGTGTVFNPTQVDFGNPLVSGLLPNISDSSLNSTGGSGLGAALIGAAVAGGIACAIPALATAIGGSFALAVGGQALAHSATAASGPNAAIAVNTNDVPQHVATQGDTLTNAGTTIASNLGLSVSLSNLIQSRVLDCFARQVAKALLQQIVQSTVAWINSGFNGSPSFVQNYNQFFTNVASQAAGNYLQSSALSFLCSPFQLQIKIAIAQSYANANNAQSCTLATATNNINNFLNGNFSSGGWPGMLSMTGTPTNNPYGAFAYGSIGIQSAAANAQGQKSFDLQASGGFLSITQNQNCTVSATQPPASPGKSVTPISPGGDVLPNGQSAPTQYQVCNVVTVTPGTAISQALNQTLGIPTQELSTAQYFDQIINALVTQLIQHVAYSGLSNLGSQGYTTSNNSGDVSSTILQSILQNIPSLQQSSQQLVDIDNENVSDIQTVLGQAAAVQNCWIKAASSATSTDASAADLQNASSTNTIIGDLSNRLTIYQGQISTANANASSLQSYQAQANSTTDLTSLENIMNNLSGQIENGAFTQDTDVVNGQEDQVELQSDLTQDSQQIATSQLQCNAQ